MDDRKRVESGIKKLALSFLVFCIILFAACVPVAPSPEIKPTLSQTSATQSGITSSSLLQVHFINVEQGDSILIDYGTVKVLIDGGDTSPRVTSYLKNTLTATLRLWWQLIRTRTILVA